nr:unnamed protein product [Spirometra erinaceieuropaei]
MYTCDVVWNSVIFTQNQGGTRKFDIGPANCRVFFEISNWNTQTYGPNIIGVHKIHHPDFLTAAQKFLHPNQQENSTSLKQPVMSMRSIPLKPVYCKI